MKIINELNRHFVNISEIVNKSKFEEINFDFIDKHLKDKLSWYAIFDITNITPLEKLIDKLDANKSCGIDGIGPNKCVFPDSLKEAFVIPIHKGEIKMILATIDPFLFYRLF